MLIAIFPDDEAGRGYRAGGRARGQLGFLHRQRTSGAPGGLYQGVGLVIEEEIVEQAARLVLRGKRQQAITLYRGLSGVTLQEATEIIDAQLELVRRWRAEPPWWMRWQRHPPLLKVREHWWQFWR